MPVTNADQQLVMNLLLGDLHATIGRKHDQLVVDNAERLRQFIDRPDEYLERVVEDTQQDIHDFFIDTTWPRCPLHQRHPLWLHDRGWWCEKDKVLVAALGSLSRRQDD
jgi:hypothetical protein